MRERGTIEFHFILLVSRLTFCHYDRPCGARHENEHPAEILLNASDVCAEKYFVVNISPVLEDV